MTIMRQDSSTELMQELIHSCQETQERFRCAADAVTNEEWKRLFCIYAQQRTRFAEELRQHLPMNEEDSWAIEARPSEPESCDARDVVGSCLAADRRSLDAYSRALAARSMPTKAHFLVSAQYSLLQRVHERVRGLCAKRAECLS